MSQEQRRRTFSITLVVIVVLSISGVAHATSWSAPSPPIQTEQGRPETAGLPTSVELAPTPSPDEVDQVSEELFCPLCTGLRLDNCDLPLCDQMREVIRQKLATGQTKEEIKAYFVEQYGDVVLGVPPKRGGMILAWLLPSLVVLVAGVWVGVLVRQRTRRAAVGEIETTESQPLPAEYVERLEREVEKFD